MPKGSRWKSATQQLSPGHIVAAGLKEAAGKLDKRMRLCAARTAHLTGDSGRALEVLAALEQELQAAGDADVAPLLLAAEIHEEVGHRGGSAAPPAACFAMSLRFVAAASQ
jgi:hypothetical protein